MSGCMSGSVEKDSVPGQEVRMANQTVYLSATDLLLIAVKAQEARLAAGDTQSLEVHAQPSEDGFEHITTPWCPCNPFENPTSKEWRLAGKTKVVVWDHQDMKEPRA